MRWACRASRFRTVGLFSLGGSFTIHCSGALWALDISCSSHHAPLSIGKVPTHSVFVANTPPDPFLQVISGAYIRAVGCFLDVIRCDLIDRERMVIIRIKRNYNDGYAES